MRPYLIAVLLLTVLFGAVAGYLYRQFVALAGMDFTPPPVTIGAAAARIDHWIGSLEAVGTIRAARGVELSTEESGEVVEVAVASGSDVTAGELILSLNDKVEQAMRERQLANLTLARLLFERDQQLVRQKSIPQSQYDRSRADLDSAVAQLAETEARLENKRIHAPFDGTVGIVHVRVGDYVEPGARITTLQDLSELEVDFTVPARHVPRLQKGLAIEVRVAVYPDRVFHARLMALDSRVEAGTRNILLRARLEAGEGLLPGMFAQMKILLGAPEPVVTVPETAVSYSLHGDTVHVIRERDGELTTIPVIVRTGETRNGRIAILAGLNGDERVVSAGQNKLYRRSRVEIDESVQF